MYIKKVRALQVPNVYWSNSFWFLLGTAFLLSCKGNEVREQASLSEGHQGTVLAATDGLGRTIPQNENVGDPQSNRQVGLFYFLWQGHSASTTSEDNWDLSELWAKNPETFEDFDHPNWGGGAGVVGKYYFWGKPIYGYYKGDDYWVHLRNIQLLTDAMVDFLVMDATNRITYPEESEALMRAMDAVRAQGKNPPKIVYYTNTASGEGMQEIYENFYKDGAPYRHPDCWFYLEGKPLIIGHSAEAKGRDYEQFFTIRESQWPNEPQKVNGWPWIEFERPQKIYQNSRGEKEIVNVSAAQHPNLDASMGGSAFYGMSGNWGRSFRNGSPGNPEEDLPYGYNVQEQWDFALEQDVPFIFVTGWNEWIAGKWRRASGNKEHAHFVDQANSEYSRDMEPSLTEGLEDHYYMQLVSNIRRYKGVEENIPLSKPKTIASFSDWQMVSPAYSDYVNDTQDRNHAGAQSRPKTQYTNTTGRNDFHEMKVARDQKHLYFYASTTESISPNTGDNWMRLYLDMDRSHATGWNGYDYRIVSGNRLQQYQGEQWETISEVEYQVEGNRMMVILPMSSVQGVLGSLNFEFKWSDNMQEDQNPLDWYVNGDVAPGGRFNFVVNE